MATLAEESKFLDISKAFNNEADIKPISNQSLKIILPCGCYSVQHAYAGGKANRSINETTERTVNRFHFFSFCQTHK